MGLMMVRRRMAAAQARAQFTELVTVADSAPVELAPPPVIEEPIPAPVPVAQEQKPARKRKGA